MRRGLFRGTWKAWLGALLTLLACGSLAPRPARAGCLHPDASRAGSPGGHAHFERLAVAGALPQAPGEGPSRPAPCSGALCSGAPAIPLAPAAIPIPPLADSWAILPALSPTLGLDSAVISRADATLHPLHAAPPIYHPPRLAHPA